MSIVTYNNRSIANISAIPGAAKSLTHIKTLTASSSSTLSFVDGSSDVVLDSTYPIYLFKFINIHSSAEAQLQVNFRDGGSSYDATKTTSAFRAYHFESDSGAGLGYQTTEDLAQSTSFQRIGQYQSSGDNDSSGSGHLYLFNPSSTVFVKHFISNYAHHYTNSAPGIIDNYIAGYCNTTTAIDGVQFKMDSGNIDSGTIKLYGIKDS
jgi:hypothetical protein